MPFVHIAEPIALNRALATLRKSGQLKRIQQTWLAKATGAPVLR